MVDYGKWDKLAAGIGDDYEQEDEDGKREWLSKWEIENAKLQREWMGEKEAAERGQADPTATWNGQPGGGLRSQLGLREECSAAAASASGDAGGGSALDQMLKMPAFQRAIRGEEDPSEEDMKQLEALAVSAQNRENPTGGYMWDPPRCAPSESDKKPVYKDAIRIGKGECDDETGGSKSGRPRLSLKAWGKIGLAPPEDGSERAQQMREQRLKTLCAAATFDEAEAAGAGGDMVRMQLLAKHRQFISETMCEPLFVPALAELLVRGNTRTLCLAADVISRLYALCLSCGAPGSSRGPRGSSMLEHLMRGVSDAGMLDTCSRLLLEAMEGGLGSAGRAGRGEREGGGRREREGEGYGRSCNPSRELLPAPILSLLCFIQTVLVFFPRAILAREGSGGAAGRGDHGACDASRYGNALR